MTTADIQNATIGAVGAVGEITTPNGKKKVNASVGVKKSVTGENIFAIQISDLRIEIPYRAVQDAAGGVV